MASGGTEGRREAKGLGVVHLVGRAMERLQMRPAGATGIIRGFGNVGSIAAVELAKPGVKVIGASDHAACHFDRQGLDVDALTSHAAERGTSPG